MCVEEKREFLNFLLGFITERRRELFYKVIENRTRHITIVLEDIYQPHNASATLRTSEIYGIQDVYVIENKNKYSVNPDVALGANKWINLHKFNQEGVNNTIECYNYLRSKGYKIFATTPHRNDITLFDLPVEDDKIALVFGSELPGLSDIAIENADGYVKIPMYGFTESFNISVSVAIFLSHLVERLHRSNVNWKLSDEEKLDILIRWAKNSVRKPDILEKEFFKTKKN
jgi:tRNA (guanosine-2'-O-)-methyltransferase